jgi:hypothetical protein
VADSPAWRRAIKKFLAALGGWVLIAFLSLYGLNLFGFCYDTLSFVTNDELLAMAMSEEYARGFPITIGGPNQARAYADAHPACCAVHRWREPSMSNPFLGALFGMRGFVVQINYPKRSSDKEGAFREAFVILNACGDILDTYRMSQSRFDPVRPAL